MIFRDGKKESGEKLEAGLLVAGALFLIGAGYVWLKVLGQPLPSATPTLAQEEAGVELWPHSHSEAIALAVVGVAFLWMRKVLVLLDK